MLRPIKVKRGYTKHSPGSVLYSAGDTVVLCTASITGGFIALVDAIRSIQKDLPNPEKYPLSDSVAAISVGIVDGKHVIDLDYAKDVEAEVDMNIVMTGAGRFIEVQGTGEEATFSEDDLNAMLKLARKGISQLSEIQAKALGKHWPFA